MKEDELSEVAKRTIAANKAKAEEDRKKPGKFKQGDRFKIEGCTFSVTWIKNNKMMLKCKDLKHDLFAVGDKFKIRNHVFIVASVKKSRMVIKRIPG